MSVALDSNPGNNGGGSSVSTVSYTGLTVGSGSNRALVAALIYTANGLSVSSVTWDSGGTNQAMTLITSANDPSSFITAALYGLVAPTSGNKTLKVVWSGTETSVSVTAVSFTGANQTGGATTFPNSTSNNGTIGGISGTATLNVTTATSDATVAALGVSNSSFTSITGGTQIFADGSFSAANFEVGGASPFAYSCGIATGCGGGSWVFVGTDIAAAAGGGGVAPSSTLLLMGVG